MMKKTIFLMIFLASVLFACNMGDKNKGAEHSEMTSNSITREKTPEGLLLLRKNCYSCHSPKASMKNRLAPPMIAVKKHYIKENTTEEEFTKDFIAFLKNPSEETSKMPGAVERFGLMAKIDFSDEDLKTIASYIYHSELEKPDWFDEHYKGEKERHRKRTGSTSALDKGNKIAMNAKRILGQNLMQAITSKGTEHALSFCSTRAIPLTDSVAMSLHAKIKRVSDKNRNPNNQANEDELAYIKELQDALARGESLSPKLLSTSTKHIGYYPILTNQMCLQCHGVPKKDISESVSDKIQALYPNDQAINYKENQVRGIWVVEFDK